MLINIITFPANFASTTAMYATEIFSDFGVFIMWIVGILLGLLFVKVVIGTIAGHRN